MAWTEKTSEELLREVLNISPGTPLPRNLYARGSDSGHRFKIPVHSGTSINRTGEIIVQDERRVFEDTGTSIEVEEETTTDPEMDWSGWREATDDWITSCQDRMRGAVSEARDGNYRDPVFDTMPDPEDYYEESEDVAAVISPHMIWCCQVVDPEGNGNERYVDHIDWVVASYLLITANEELFKDTAQERTDEEHESDLNENTYAEDMEEWEEDKKRFLSESVPIV